jgi:PAS domain S-box-containing protein
MQKKTINILVIMPDQKDLGNLKELLHQIKKWKFELQLETDFNTAAQLATGGNYDIVLVDDNFGKHRLDELFDKLDNSIQITPVILLLSNQEHLDSLDHVIAKSAGYLEKGRMAVDDLEHTIQYGIALGRAVEQLRASQKRLRSIFYGAAIGIALLEPDGQIIETNPGLHKITGYSHEELCSFFLKDIFDQASAGKIEDIYLKMIAGRQDFFQIEERISHKSGRKLWVRLTASIYIEVEEGMQIRFAVALFEDITERKQTEAELRRSKARLQALSRKTLDAQENERKLLVQEIHDSIGGSLAAIKFGLEEKLETMPGSPPRDGISLEKIIAMVQETIQETRRISAHLRPSMLDDLGLFATIDWLCREFEKLYPEIRIQRKLAIQETNIAESLKVVIYRVLQEAMNNVAKHSEAEVVKLSLIRAGRNVELSIVDNGRGFNLEEAISKSDPMSGYGLTGMLDRAEICGGRLNIASIKGQGTTIHLILPNDLVPPG